MAADLSPRIEHQVLPFDEWKNNSPPTLLESACMTFLKNLPLFCEVRKDILYLKPDIAIPVGASDVLLEKYVRMRHVIDLSSFDKVRRVVEAEDDSFLSVFFNHDHRVQTRLKRARLEDLKLTADVVNNLIRSHLDLEELYINVADTNGSIMESITQLGSRLTKLNFHNFHSLFSDEMQRYFRADDTGCPSPYKQRQYIVNAPNLLSLGIKRTQLPTVGMFNLFLKPMVKLQHLDLSLSLVGSFAFFNGHLQKTLQSLCLYGVKISNDDFQIIATLTKLKYLDVSQAEILPDQNPSCLRLLNESLPDLEYLDISYTCLCDPIAGAVGPDSRLNDVPSSIEGLRGRKKPLEFLGLFQCRNGACQWSMIPALRVSGDANEAQIVISLQIYMYRPRYLHKALNDAYRLLRYEICTKPHLILKLILDAMFMYPKSMRIQIAGSAALFYVVRNDGTKNMKMDPYMRRQVIRAIVMAMGNNLNEQTMLRNGCLTLCQFHIPNEVMFLYRDVVTVLLKMLRLAGLDEFLLRIGVLLLNSLACQVENEHKMMVGEMKAVETMIDIIENRLRDNNCDEVMEVSWSMMWNVTDETPKNCERFLDKNGMGLFLRCLTTFSDRGELLRNMMGLLGNVAEVQHLRNKLMNSQYIKVFSNLLDSTSDGIEVSYNACGVLAHICSDGPTVWTIDTPTYQEIQDKMIDAINRWPLRSKRNINYRSFEPILRLIPWAHSPASQHWACWALANLTRVYPDKYCPLLEKERGLERLQPLKDAETPARVDTKKLVNKVFSHYERFLDRIPVEAWSDGEMDVSDLEVDMEIGDADS
ncbi:protein zer-1 homolog [Paramacrobiotus metropolitanus]|uniref:protein zer-1 homolog n=1 Tax=Paramacrobiotus metropolitanus TaxID=2943436 RepID=UPI002445D39F|nr:protein zer-1 homolog [Paramacrobiotus metropolitanus]XP_055335611.1 protein zer-1 homolog [Paramacrobiotus metropolitanus]